MTDADTPNSSGSGDVLSSLPSARPQRRSPKRDGSKRAKPAKQSAAPGASRAKRGAASSAKQSPSAPTRKRAPAASGSKPIAAQGYHPVDATPVEPPTGTEILVSAVQAAGEVAQIGLTLGERLLRAAASRLPKP